MLLLNDVQHSVRSKKNVQHSLSLGGHVYVSFYTCPNRR